MQCWWQFTELCPPGLALQLPASPRAVRQAASPVCRPACHPSLLHCRPASCATPHTAETASPTCEHAGQCITACRPAEDDCAACHCKQQGCLAGQAHLGAAHAEQGTVQVPSAGAAQQHPWRPPQPRPPEKGQPAAAAPASSASTLPAAGCWPAHSSISHAPAGSQTQHMRDQAFATEKALSLNEGQPSA